MATGLDNPGFDGHLTVDSVDKPGFVGHLTVDSVDKPGQLCSLCTMKDRHTRASKYCVDCEYFLCSDCSRSHDLLLPMDGHVVKDVTQVIRQRPATKQQAESRLGSYFCFLRFPCCFSLWNTKKLSESKHALYIVEEKHEVTGRVPRDNSDNWIFGSSVMNDGTTLLVDHSNMCLKRVAPNGHSVFGRRFLFSVPPYSVCSISQDEAAVTLPSVQQVKIVSLGPKLTVKRTLEVGIECDTIAHYNDELFMSDWDEIYVFSVTGKMLRTFNWKGSDVPWLKDICDMVVSSDGRLLFVAVGHGGLLAVDRVSGEGVWRYDMGDLQDAVSVCIDGKGSLFVCGSDSHNVLQFLESGQKVGYVVSLAKDKIISPGTISFVPNTNTLVVSHKYHYQNDLTFLKLSQLTGK